MTFMTPDEFYAKGGELRPPKGRYRNDIEGAVLEANEDIYVAIENILEKYIRFDEDDEGDVGGAITRIMTDVILPAVKGA